MTPMRVLPVLAVLATSLAAQAKLVRYPHQHQGKIAFTYLADIWTADESGENVRRLTVHPARDAYPRFSPDGRWIAFSSDRAGNLDVFIVPVEGGTPAQLTFHSAADQVVGWTPDSKQVLFSSNRGEHFAPRLYTVSVSGGMPRSAGVDIGLYGSYAPDGTRLAYNRKSQAYWRKGYRGSNQSDVTVLEIGTGHFTDLTDFEGMDTWPMWGRDGFIYFVSDREGNTTNIWRVPERGGSAERVTAFRTGEVRWPAISADGRVIVFEHDFGLWRLDVASRQARAIPLTIAAELQASPTELRTFRSEADDYDLAPAGRRIVVSVHGELFTAPVEAGDLVQLTHGAARDRDPVYSPDGDRVAYVSDASGREEVYVVPADGGEVRKITNLDVLKSDIAWAPDGKTLAFTASDNVLRTYGLESQRTTELVTSRYGSINAPTWSPDGNWIAFSMSDHSRASDVYLVPASGGEAQPVTFDEYSETSPRFSPDGKTLYYLLVEGPFGGGSPPNAQLYSVGLERLTADPDDPATRPDRAGAGGEDEEAGPGRRSSARRTPVSPVAIDWPGMKRRSKQLTTMPASVGPYAISPDGRTIVFVTQDRAGPRSTPSLYSMGDDGRRVSRVAALSRPGGDDDDDGPPGGFGFRGGISGLAFTPDGRSVYFRQGSGVYSVALRAGAEGAPSREATPRRVTFTAKVQIDQRAEWEQMFGDAWRTMKYRFYDPGMHGKDWDAMRAKYEPLVTHVGDRDELLNVVNEMIGELNASHTGARPPGGFAGGAVSTPHLGLELTPDERAGRYRVTHVFAGGPADKDWVKAREGDYLIAINGTPVAAGDNYFKILNERLNQRVEVTLNDKPTPDGAWTSRVNPVSGGQANQLRYERWVTERREMVAKLSDGRIGYLHIQAMNQPSLRRFEKELRQNRDKEALVVDQRWNGGGNIEQELLAILVQREYQIWQPRGTESAPRPFAGYFGPKVVLQNWRSASNAEMFPAGFRALGLGKVIGEPTAGAVIGTGSYTLIDGSTVRTPGVGVYLADAQRTNMENYGVQPDILVRHMPEDDLAGRDPQLERAVQELLRDVGTHRATNGGGR